MMGISNGYLLPYQFPWVNEKLFKFISKKCNGSINPSKLFSEFDAIIKPISGNSIKRNSSDSLGIRNNNNNSQDIEMTCMRKQLNSCIQCCHNESKTAKEVSVGVSRTLNIELNSTSNHNNKITCILDPCYRDMETEVISDAHRMIRLLTKTEDV